MRRLLPPLFCCLLCWQLTPIAPLWAQEGGLRITVLAGEGANNSIDTGQGTAPVVQVLDAQGEPVAGAEVRFTAPLTGPSVTFFGAANTTALLTGQEGRAQAPAMLPNTYEGPFTIEVTASHEGRTTAVSIQQVNTAAEPVAKKKRWGWRVWMGIGIAVTIGIIAAVNDGSD